MNQGNNARKINCGRVYSAYWAEFVNKNRCISVCWYQRKIKTINFDNSENSHKVSYDQNIS